MLREHSELFFYYLSNEVKLKQKLQLVVLYFLGFVVSTIIIFLSTREFNGIKQKWIWFMIRKDQHNWFNSSLWAQVILLIVSCTSLFGSPCLEGNFIFTLDRRQSQMLILLTNVDQKALETEFWIAICRQAALKHCFLRFLICVCQQCGFEAEKIWYLSNICCLSY